MGLGGHHADVYVLVLVMSAVQAHVVFTTLACDVFYVSKLYTECNSE